MSAIVKETKTVERTADESGRDDRRIADDTPGGNIIVARIIYIITGIIMILLAFRFLLSLLGANRSSSFADFIYSTSLPFASPFFGLFNYDAQYGSSRFEFETLIAIAVYAFIGWLLVRLLTVASRPSDGV